MRKETFTQNLGKNKTDTHWKSDLEYSSQDNAQIVTFFPKTFAYNLDHHHNKLRQYFHFERLETSEHHQSVTDHWIFGEIQEDLDLNDRARSVRLNGMVINT